MHPYNFAVFLQFVLYIKLKLFKVFYLVIFLQRNKVFHDKASRWLIFNDLFEHFFICRDVNSQVFLLLQKLFLSRRLHLFYVEILAAHLQTHHRAEGLLGLKLRLKVDIRGASKLALLENELNFRYFAEASAEITDELL